MNLISKKLVALAAVTCLVSSSVFALTKSEVDAINLKMTSVKVVEAPLTAAKLVTAAEKLDKEETAVTVVKSVAVNQPAALKKVIVVVLTRVPEATEAVVRAALEVAPKSASVIVAAAAEANPSKIDLIAGIARAVLVVEAADKSGTLITAHLTLDYNRELLAVPGPITSPTSLGANLLIKQGATPITRSEDILEIFRFKQETLFEESARELENLSDEERKIIELLNEPMPRDTIVETLGKPMSEINSLLSVMEIKGLVKEEYGEMRRVL